MPNVKWTEGSIAATLLCLAATAFGSLDRPGHAASMVGSWSGASANVSLFDQSRSQQGATAEASAGETIPIHYQGSPAFNPPQYFDSWASGNISASAGVDPAHLLQVDASASAPNPGTLGGPTPHNAIANASWTDDSAIVTAPAGSSLPDAIRLNFTLTYSVPGATPSAALTPTVDGKELDGWSTPVTGYGTTNTRTDTFHLDLPLSTSGHSDPFSLGLQLSPYVGLLSNGAYRYDGLTANLALAGVTLPDGTSLASLGDSVSFDSGLPAPDLAPEPVPEPESLLIWGLTIAAAGATAVRRSRVARKGR
jgi:hypothetical protein